MQYSLLCPGPVVDLRRNSEMRTQAEEGRAKADESPQIRPFAGGSTPPIIDETLPSKTSLHHKFFRLTPCVRFGFGIEPDGTKWRLPSSSVSHSSRRGPRVWGALIVRCRPQRSRYPASNYRRWKGGTSRLDSSGSSVGHRHIMEDPTDARASQVRLVDGRLNFCVDC